MKNNKHTAKERNEELTKTQEVTYAQEMNSIPQAEETKEQTNEDYSYEGLIFLLYDLDICTF
ncbi:hypothetical protein KUV80_17165 [Fictibacillus nanhaiensis]|uniref:hypothetical protein n=1 Tax=Fictibacillus nanhaiensis TaxID=742169 RepID=UPI001C968C24|nr:hypothetical protein [Fictibacillus nanhaiensis]MBY6038371.1 hypothetical protein [Fictibacillus nanhaiensis]